MLQMHVPAAAGAHTKVVFGGHGADVLFGGMPAAPAGRSRRAAADVQRAAAGAVSTSQCGLSPSSLLGRALQTAVYGKTPPQALRVPGTGNGGGCSGRPEVNEFIRATIQRMHSHNYLEPHHELAGASLHSPFLDPDMIATSLTVPGWLKSGWRRQKWCCGRRRRT